MVRPRKSQAPDLTQAADLTAGLIERLACPAGKAQVFLRDAKAPGLRVRATPPSAKSPDPWRSHLLTHLYSPEPDPASAQVFVIARWSRGARLRECQ
jgi:hypothetical protein